MAKSTQKRAKRTVPAKRQKKPAAKPKRIAEYVSCLLELHKLQGVLLTEMEKEVQSK